MRPQSIFAASFLLASTSLSFAQDVTFESLLDEMVDRDELAKTPVHSFTLGQASSYDRDNGPNNIDQVDFNTNQDGSGSIRWEDINGDREYFWHPNRNTLLQKSKSLRTRKHTQD